jgi:hypothetical protein
MQLRTTHIEKVYERKLKETFTVALQKNDISSYLLFFLSLSKYGMPNIEMELRKF